jgi:hypothetical protein
LLNPPENIYSLPLNESCKEEYLDHSSNNLCFDSDSLCSDEYNCPRLAMPQFNPHATLSGFIAWYGNGSDAYIPAKGLKIC